MYSGSGLGSGRGLGFGRGFGRGMGMGRGRGFWRRGFGGFYGYPYSAMAPFPYPLGAMPYSQYPPSQEEEQAKLEEQAKFLEEQLEQIGARLKEMRKAGKEKTSEK